MQSAVGIPHARPFPVWIGFVLCGVIFCAEVFDRMTRPSGLHWYYYSACLIAIIYYLMCVSRFHRILCEVTFDAYSIEPAEAVFYHFLPLFNIYWLYAWPKRFADFVNAEHALKVVPGAIIGTILLASALTARFFDAAIGMAGYFVVMVYLTNRLNQYADYRDLDVAAGQLAPGAD